MTNLEERLAHANGALGDIATTITSCVSQNASDETKALARSVLNRILCSASMVHREPGWYVHEYEREEYERYLTGKTKACASDSPCIEEAQRLCGTAPIPGNYDPSRLADFIAAEIGKYGEDAEKFYRSVFGDALTVKKDEVAKV
jgi:hypothetical protein